MNDITTLVFCYDVFEFRRPGNNELWNQMKYAFILSKKGFLPIPDHFFYILTIDFDMQTLQVQKVFEYSVHIKYWKINTRLKQQKTSSFFTTANTFSVCLISCKTHIKSTTKVCYFSNFSCMFLNPNIVFQFQF